MRKKGKPNPDQRYCYSWLTCVFEVEKRSSTLEWGQCLQKISAIKSVGFFQILGMCWKASFSTVTEWYENKTSQTSSSWLEILSGIMTNKIRKQKKKNHDHFLLKQEKFLSLRLHYSDLWKLLYSLLICSDWGVCKSIFLKSEGNPFSFILQEIHFKNIVFLSISNNICI